MARKTVQVADLVEKVNHYLRESRPEQAEARKALAALLTSVLLEADQYAGFGYIDKVGYDYSAGQMIEDSRRRYNWPNR